MYSTHGFFFLFFLCFAEIEAKEACDWLRAAGFPQYAQLYEGNQSAFTQQPYFTQRLPLLNLSLCSFLFLVFSLTLIFFHHHHVFLSLFLPSLHPHIPIFWASAFYFQASVPVQREGSWERPCYLCWDSHSVFLPLSSFFHLSPSTLSARPPLFFHSASLSKPAFSYLFFSFCPPCYPPYCLPSTFPCTTKLFLLPSTQSEYKKHK